MLALAVLTLELETCCPDWLPLTFDLLKKTQVPEWLLEFRPSYCLSRDAQSFLSSVPQISSSELIWSRELVSGSLSAPRPAAPPNTVFIYQPQQTPGMLEEAPQLR